MALIAFDCDGPLAEFAKGFCEGLTARGFPRHESTIQHWDLSASLGREEAAIADEVIGAPGFCYDLEWVPGAKSVVRALRALGADAVCVTSPYHSRTWIEERRAWLSELFTSDDVLFVKSARKYLIAADLLIEDHPGIAAAWLDAHPKGHAILVDRPWNQPTSLEYWPHTRMFRAHDMGEVLALAREFAT